MTEQLTVNIQAKLPLMQGKNPKHWLISSSSQAGRISKKSRESEWRTPDSRKILIKIWRNRLAQLRKTPVYRGVSDRTSRKSS